MNAASATAASAPSPAAPPSTAPARFLWQDVGLYAGFELRESLRTRLIVVLLFLFIGSGALAAWGFTEMVAGLEKIAADATGAPTTEKPGATLQQIRRQGAVRGMFKAFLGDDAKVEYFADLPPLVIFFGWVALAFTPWLVLFATPETIAAEVGSRAIRYGALRAGRLEIALGKAVGQALLLAGVLTVFAASFFVVGWINLAGFEVAATARGLLSFLPRIFLHDLPFLSFAMLASMLTRSTNVARTLAVGGGMALQIAEALAAWKAKTAGPLTGALLDAVAFVVPFGHRDGLFYPPGGKLPVDVTACVALTVLYFSVGFAVLRRRDI